MSRCCCLWLMGVGGSRWSEAGEMLVDEAVMRGFDGLGRKKVALRGPFERLGGRDSVHFRRKVD